MRLYGEVHSHRATETAPIATSNRPILNILRLYTHLLVYFGILFNTYAYCSRLSSHLSGDPAPDSDRLTSLSSLLSSSVLLNKQIGKIFFKFFFEKIKMIKFYKKKCCYCCCCAVKINTEITTEDC